MSLFFVDSASDLDDKLIKKIGIESINLPYAINDNRKEFDVEFEYDKFYSKYNKGVCVSSVNLTEQEYIDIFEPCLKQGDDIVYVYTSSKLKDDSALLSAKDLLLSTYPQSKIQLIDSCNISIGQGLISYECAMLYRKGLSVDEIYEESFNIKNSYALYFACDSIEQLSNNNIISNSTVAGTALNIKPILGVNFDGEIELVDKVSGKKKIIYKLLELCRQTGQNVADYPIGIVYSNDSKMAEELKEKLIETFGHDINILMQRLTPSNAALMGNNILGISFHVHKKKL